VVNPLIEALVSSVVLAFLSLAGLVFFYFRERAVDKSMLPLTAFASGLLVGVSFLYALPKALEETGLVAGAAGVVFSVTLLGAVVCFILERVFYWRHLHEGISEIIPFTNVNLLGDALHYLLVGAALVAAYSIPGPHGPAVFLAFLAHTVPQELSDSAQLLHGGARKLKMVVLNFASASGAIVGVLVFGLIFNLADVGAYLLAFAAGAMMYIGVVDIVPRLRLEELRNRSVIQLAFFIFGVLLVQGTSVLAAV
jgi:zinc transporter ZupT